MRLRGYSPDGPNALSYVNNPSGSYAGSRAADLISKLFRFIFGPFPLPNPIPITTPPTPTTSPYPSPGLYPSTSLYPEA